MHYSSGDDVTINHWRFQGDVLYSYIANLNIPRLDTVFAGSDGIALSFLTQN